VRDVQPRVYLIARPSIDYGEIRRFLADVGGEAWLARTDTSGSNDAQNLVEFAGRLCYRSWDVGLNPNVTQIRQDQAAYLRNVLAQRHGSVLQHATFTLLLHNVSRVLTHELIRHTAGTAVSQESLRFVRLAEIPFWTPDWARDDAELTERIRDLVGRMEEFQRWTADRYDLDDPDTPFHVKKRVTSFARRLAPEGVTTTILFTANVRALRHIIETRTTADAEEEIRRVAGMIAERMRAEVPDLFGDYHVTSDGTWVPRWRKV